MCNTDSPPHVYPIPATVTLKYFPIFPNGSISLRLTAFNFQHHAKNSGLNSALSRIMNTINGNVFDKNLFIILGSDQNLKINENLIARAGQKSASFLFVQTNRSYDTPYQDFVLQAKSTLDELSRQYVNHIANYIVDDKLIKPELFRNLETDEANIFLFDVPSRAFQQEVSYSQKEEVSCTIQHWNSHWTLSI